MTEYLGQILFKIHELYASTAVAMLCLAALFTVLAVATSQACNPETRWWRNPGLITDVWYVLLDKVMQPYLVIPIVVLVHATLSGVMSPAEIKAYFAEGRGPLAGIGFWWQVPIYMIGFDFLSYWIHRLFHGNTLWRFHAIHHSSKELDWTSTYRFHPVNIMLQQCLIGFIMISLGISPVVAAFLVPWDILSSALVHANLNWTFGPFKYVLASPVFHRWHHCGPDDGGNMNFAPTFSFLDYIFGTFHMPPDRLPSKFGVDDPNFPDSYLGQMLYPFKPQTEPGMTTPQPAHSGSATTS